MRLALVFLIAVCANAQFFPFPGPGTIAHSGGSSPAFVQGKVCNVSTTGTTNACAFPGSIGSNHIIVAIFRWDNSGSARTATFSSSAGVTCTWSSLTSVVPSGSSSAQAMQSAYCLSPSAGAETVTGTLSSSSGFSDLMVLEFSGVTAVDVSAVSAFSNTNTTPCASGSTGTLTGTGRLVVGFCGMWNQTQAWANTGNFTYLSGVSGANTTIAAFDYVSGTTSPVSFSYAVTADQWTSLVAVFK